MNRVVLVGRLTRDPDLRYTPNGVAVATFTVAVNRPFKNQQGEQEADFVNCVVWRKQAENLANYMKKGSQVGVDGRVQTRSYDNQEGRKVFVTEVLVESITYLEPRGSGSAQQGQQGGAQQKGNFQQAQQQFQPQGYPPQQQQGQGNYQNAPQPQGQGGGNPHGAVDIQDGDLPF